MQKNRAATFVRFHLAVIKKSRKSHRCTQGEGGGPKNMFIKMQLKLLNTKKETPLDFLTTPSTPLKIICPKSPGPPPLDFQLLCIYERNHIFFENSVFFEKINSLSKNIFFLSCVHKQILKTA